MKFREILGIDFGGSGIKGAPVDTKKGKLLEKKFRIATPAHATPQAVIEIISEIKDKFSWKGPIGMTFPSVVQNSIVKTAANIDHSWIGVNASELIKQHTGLPAFVVNDADAAGLAEMKFGAGKDVNGLVLLVTVGTGIGSVLFTQGKLVPNTEFGHIYLQSGIDAELITSDAARQREKLTWVEWAKRFDVYLHELEKLLWPELIIIGGGISKKPELFMDHLTVNSKVVMAKSKNEAGIIGAALAAKVNRDLLEKSIFNLFPIAG
jgi:polyphosphate glucokinase